MDELLRGGRLLSSKKSESKGKELNPIERVNSDEAPTGELSQRDRVVVLIVGSNPDNTGRLRLDREARAIREELAERARHRDGFRVEMRPALRVQDLQRVLRDVQPDILHFGGHGEKDGLMVENLTGGVHPISISALKETMALHNQYLRCVVLNACYSETQARAIAEHVACVVGMSNAVRDDAAIAFAREFYAAIGAGENVERAFHAGRLQIDLENLRDEDKPRLKARVDPTTITFVPTEKGETTMAKEQRKTTFNQEGQNVGKQINTGGDAQIGQIGDVINMGGGDYVRGDKSVTDNSIHTGGGSYTGGDSYSVGSVTGGAVAFGRGATANQTNIQQGASEAEMVALFMPLLQAVSGAGISAENKQTALKHVQELKTEVAKGEQADDNRLAGLVQDIADLAPGAVEQLVGLFTNSIVAKLAGGATNFVIGRLRH